MKRAAGLLVIASLGACTTVVNNMLPAADAGSDSSDASSDGPNDSAFGYDTRTDVSCPEPIPAPDAGENCIAGGTCSEANSCEPHFGYVCYDGRSPRMPGCMRIDDGGSMVGDASFLIACCPTARCVRTLAMDTTCSIARDGGKAAAFSCHDGVKAGLPDGCVPYAGFQCCSADH